MKSKLKKSLAFLLAFVMVFTIVGVQLPVTASAETKIALSCKTKRVAIGGTYTLTVEGVSDDNAIYMWASSNRKVATVSTVSKEGVVTGIEEGTATIKCKIKMSDKSTQILSCKVTVLEQEPATSIKISNAKLDENNVHTIVVGENYDFNRKLSPAKSNDKTYWYIQDKEYAEVDSKGVVTAKKAGTTVLIAKVGIDRISAEESTNTVIDSVCLNIVEPTSTPEEPKTEEPKQEETSPDVETMLQAMKAANVNDYVTFGTYEQDNVKDNGPEAIEWRVLDKKDGKVLLLSNYALEYKAYNEEYSEEVTWETCTLRKWLNEEFYNTAFTSAEKQYIAESCIINTISEQNKSAVSSDGNPTYDNVFLLSVDEVTTYMGPSLYEGEGRLVEVTQYAKPDKTGLVYGFWLLRSSGEGRVGIVNKWGEIMSDMVDNYSDVVRPAIWVEVE